MIDKADKGGDAVLIREFKTEAGILLLGSYKEKLCLCDWKYRRMRDVIDRRIQSLLACEYRDGHSEVTGAAMEQLNEYFAGGRKDFTIPLLPLGSVFQKQVWEELLKIPYGETASYGKLAAGMGKKEAVRAVASANGANALSILIPCHRIIGAKGELVGYAGGLKAKEKLLELESAVVEQYTLF